MFLQLVDLCKMYTAENGLRELNLSVEEGSFVTLLGPSGCGKTTTLNLLGGFVKADHGSILLEGREIIHLPPERRPVSTVFQSYALFPHLNVLDNVAYGLRFQGGLPKRVARERAYEYLDVVGLSGYPKAHVGNLSGGEQQRVALARAMATQPKILLLDEPLSNLDTSLRVKMRGELKELQKKLSITMIFVTHDQSEALCLSDQIVVMEQGAAVQTGSPGDIYFRPRSGYVASFVGKSNLISQNGKTIVVRPEDIKMTADRNGECRIEEIIFMGAHTEYYLSRKSERLEVDIAGAAAGGFQIGQQVSISILHTIELD